MVRIYESTTLADVMQTKAAEWYKRNVLPKAFRNAHPDVLVRAAKLSNGDWQRCIIEDDGSITVCNNQVW